MEYNYLQNWKTVVNKFWETFSQLQEQEGKTNDNPYNIEKQLTKFRKLFI